jgi:hypothetical protein
MLNPSKPPSFFAFYGTIALPEWTTSLRDIAESVGSRGSLFSQKRAMRPGAKYHYSSSLGRNSG